MTARCIYWQDGAHRLGYLEEFPDYLTQGESLEDLQDHLKDLFDDLTGGAVPGVRRAAELALGLDEAAGPDPPAQLEFHSQCREMRSTKT